MTNNKSFLNQVLIVAFLMVGAIAISAVFFQYSGNIKFKFGADGIQLEVIGQSKEQKILPESK